MNPSASPHIEGPDRELLGRDVGRELRQFISSSTALVGLVQKLSARGRVVVFGGFVRDRMHELIHGETVPLRDLDLVVDGRLGAEFDSSSKNNFGGSRVVLGNGLKVDYWELRSTYAFSKGWIEPALENLPATTVYSVNACYFDLEEQRIVESGAAADIARRTIAFNCRMYLDQFPDYQAFRGMELAHRLGYQMSAEVRSFVAERMRQSPKAVFLRAVRQHRSSVSEAELEELCRPYAGGEHDHDASQAGETEVLGASSRRLAGR
jgi:hypothetical protein